MFVVGTPVASAQIAPGGGLGPGMGGPSQPSGEDKKEGVAEAAPKAPGLLPTTPALPAPKGRRKRWKLLELDGYYRMRTDWFKNFNLGFPDGGVGGSPFPTALGCKSTLLDHPCDNSLSSANMRLRLEPTINLDEGTSIHVQADLLDNLVLGSTPSDPVLGKSYVDPTSLNGPPAGPFNNGTQAPVAQGINSDRSAIQIKRAWAEVAIPFGILKFGRMPNHWGMGILYNGGGADPINGGYDYDADYGDTVDRASFSLLIPGTNLRAMVASDWALSRLVSNQTSANVGHEGHPFDLDDSDDVNSWVGVISRMDSPQEFKDTVDRGELALNYGMYFEYKTQSWDDNLKSFTLGSTPDPTNYQQRGLKVYSPDLWGKLGIGRFTIEGEVVAQLGSTSVVTRTDMNNLPISTKYDIRKYGGAGRLTWRGIEGKLRLGLETGFASGDQWDNTPQGNTNLAYANPIGDPANTNERTLTQFAFNRNYRVDMIMWRHLFGAVTNAGYVKPFVQYDVTKSITFKVSNISSFALRPVATPGNSTMYGTEFNGDLGYTSGGMFIGISYGVLFPFGAMSHPADPVNPVTGEPDPMGQHYGYTDYSNSTPDTSNAKDAETAHTIQSRFVLAF
ncbi:MAG TPA: TIGR04551 family protein [Kofleriaceae bacterium]|nr:TIGR04551 family protein [Kofleriaceae bacterium]